jgi:alkylation response protein AidB-like acyl-CoA dehydrogenase
MTVTEQLSSRTTGPMTEPVPLARLLETLAETAAEADRLGRPVARAVAQLRASEAVGVLVPVEYGGRGEGPAAANAYVARVAAVDPSTAIILAQHYAVCARVQEWGSAEQRRTALPRLARGEWLAASAWSEQGVGAAKRRLGTWAHRHAGGWRITGSKAFTTSAGLADLYLVLAQTAEDTGDTASYGSSSQSFFLVPAADGVRCRADLDLVGMRGSATGAVEFAGCELPATAILGAEGGAARIIAGVRQSGLTLGAVSVGVAQAALDLAGDRLRRRGPAAVRSAQGQLCEMEMRLEAARGLVERAGRRSGPDPGRTVLHSKVFAARTAERVCRDALRLVGSAGYLRGEPAERLHRDARAVALMGPTNDLCWELLSQAWAS